MHPEWTLLAGTALPSPNERSHAGWERPRMRSVVPCWGRERQSAKVSKAVSFECSDWADPTPALNLNLTRNLNHLALNRTTESTIKITSKKESKPDSRTDPQSFARLVHMPRVDFLT